jgi:hypothetical protein
LATHPIRSTLHVRTPSADTGDAEASSSCEIVIGMLSEIPLAALLRPDGVAGRLNRMLQETELGELALRSFVSRRVEIEAWMMRTPNCGRRSVLELRTRVSSHVYHALVAAGMDSDDASEAAEFLLAAPAVTEASVGGPPDGLVLADLMNWHLQQTKPRSKEILTRRFGLGGGPKQTLADIGLDLSLTRERVRQVEAKELRRIRELCLRFPLDAHLDRERALCVEQLFGDRVHATHSEVERFARDLTGHLELAIEVAGHDRKSWLTQGAKELPRGWLRPGTDADLVLRSARLLAESVGSGALPRAFAPLIVDMEPRHALAAAQLELGWHVESGYAFRRRPWRRALRTATLHAVLSAIARPVGVAELLARYHDGVPTDICSDRDLIIVMEDAPHLFLELEEARWTSLGAYGEPPVPVVDDAEAATPRDDGDIDDGTVASALERTLRTRGPTRVGTLIDDALDILPSGRSPRSVGPTLLTNPSRFVRALPGVWALPEQIPTEPNLAKADVVDYLLNPTQARSYALARRAGEPWGCYPIWTPTAEMRLCRWARRQGEAELLSSLLAIASIDKWPTDDEDKARWLDAKARGSRFELCFDPRPSFVALTPDRVLALALALVDHGTLGWITVNRTLRYQACAHIAAGVLETLARAEIVTPPTGSYAWQLPHLPGPRLQEWVERLTDIIHRKGLVDWDEAELGELGAGIRNVIPAVLSAEASATDEMDELELLMAEHRRAMRARRLQEQFDEADV